MINRNSYVLLTGATSDIGKVIAKKLETKYKLILHGRNHAKLDHLKEELHHKDHLIWLADLNEIDKVGVSLSNLIIEEGIYVKNFIHCAGDLRIVPVRLCNLEIQKRIFNVNFHSAYEIVRILIAKKNKVYMENIVFMSSIFSKFGVKCNSVYSASKGAIDSLVKSLAVELAPNIKVNSLLLGPVRTKMLEEENTFDERHAEYMSNKCLLGPSNINDIGEIVSVFLSESTRWVTGQNIIIDGGFSCHI
jgi:short-subunit dehydrogenase